LLLDRAEKQRPVSAGLISNLLLNDELSVHQHEVTRERTEVSVIAPGHESSDTELDRSGLTAADHVSRGEDALVTGRQVVRRARRLTRLREGLEVRRGRQNPIVAHDVRCKLTHVLQRYGHFLAALADLELLLVELDLIVRLDRERTFLTPSLLGNETQPDQR